jgi:hypothetical protein
MELFNVKIKSFYNARYEGKIGRHYDKLVWANSKEEAVKFVNKDLEIFEDENVLFPKEESIAISAYRVDSTKRIRKTQYYTPPKLKR